MEYFQAFRMHIFLAAVTYLCILTLVSAHSGIPTNIFSSQNPELWRQQENDIQVDGLPFRDSSSFQSNPALSETTPPLNFLHGTTTLAFIFKDGIIVAVDSRASMGKYISSRTTMKLVPVTENIIGTMAGGAADCSYWLRRLSAKAQLHQMTYNTPMTVRMAAKSLAMELYSLRGAGLSVGTMLAGYGATGRPELVYVDNDGAHVAGNVFSVGSGSTYAYGVLDAGYRFDMTTDEAIELGLKAIRHATYRDAYSGGYINIVHVTRDGWKQVNRKDAADISIQSFT